MRFLLASDSFKHALPAAKACRAMARGLADGCPEVEIRQVPLADGGEGTAALLTQQAGGEGLADLVRDPLGNSVLASWGWIARRRTAYIDLASASGLERLAEGERNPMYTSTFGTGQLIRAALDKGAETIFLGLGGSATHDLGLGMAAALGCRFLDARGSAIVPKGHTLSQIRQLDTSGLDTRLSGVRLEVLCDVRHTLTGPESAARVFAAQKGADPAGIEQLESGSRRLARLLEEHAGRPIAAVPGSGAAGGSAAGAMALLGGRLRSGIEVVLNEVGIQQHLVWCDWVITGEGRLDETSLQGKVVGGLLRAANARSKPVLVLCGRLALPPQTWASAGICAAWSINSGALPLAEALARTPAELYSSTLAISRLLCFRNKNFP